MQSLITRPDLLMRRSFMMIVRKSEEMFLSCTSSMITWEASERVLENKTQLVYTTTQEEKRQNHFQKYCPTNTRLMKLAHQSNYINHFTLFDSISVLALENNWERVMWPSEGMSTFCHFVLLFWFRALSVFSHYFALNYTKSTLIILQYTIVP